MTLPSNTLAAVNPHSLTITLPLPHLASLLFGEFADKHFPKVPSLLSVSPGDLGRPEVTHYVIGQIIAEQDVGEAVFHVELFPASEGSDAHAEVWLIREWLECNTRYTRRKVEAEARRVVLDSNKSLITALTDELTAVNITINGKKTGVPECFCQLLAHEIALNYQTTDMRDIIRLWGLEQTIQEHEAKKEQNHDTKL